MSVVIYGGSGWTGAQVAQQLLARGRSVVLAGRDEQRLRHVSDRSPGRPPIRVAAYTDPGALARAFSEADVVINCAGPFVESGERVLAAAVRAGAHYLDVSGEKSHVARVHERWSSEARRAGVCVCPGFGAKGGLGDWVAHHAAGRVPDELVIDEVLVAYGHKLREFFRPSIGSALASAGQGFFEQAALTLGPLERRRFEFPPPFDRGDAVPVPAGEDVTIGRHVAAGRVKTYISLDPGGPSNDMWTSLLMWAAPYGPALGRILFSEWGRLHLRLYLPPPELDHDEDTFALSVEVRAGDHVERLCVSMRDAYVATSHIVCLGVARLLDGATTPTGVVAPSELCAAGATLRRLVKRGAIRVLREARP